LGFQDDFALGNLSTMRDWGFAGDYVKAMHLMLQHNAPDDYVIATGVSHSARDFVEAAAKAQDCRGPCHEPGRYG
jgi:GDPmannose 4,6-dehydratase